MTPGATPATQPDQQSRLWDAHVPDHETVFEPLTNVFAQHALRALALPPGSRCLDVAAGSDAAAFRDLLAAAALTEIAITRVEAALEAPDAAWLAPRLAFAPGLAALLAAQGDAREADLARFVSDLERDQGSGPVRLGAVAFVGTGSVRSRGGVSPAAP